MASLRMLKKDIEYLMGEILSDSYLTMYLHPEKKEQAIGIMEEAVALRNDLFHQANNPVEKNNRHLVRKHYAQIRRDMFENIDKLFSRLSELNK